MGGGDVFEFADFTLEVSERRLARGGCAIPLAPKAYDVLVALVRNSGRLVTKSELLQLVWPDSFVEEGILAVHISALRKALGNGAGIKPIETVARSGYRFTYPVRRVEDEASARLRSIAVLPALATGEKAEHDEHMGMAIAEAVIDHLGRCRELIVRPERAVVPYLDEARDPAAIGRGLEVEAVVDSQFRRMGERVRLSASLIRTQDSARIWSGEWSEPPAEMARVAAAIAKSVSASLGLEIDGLLNRRADSRPAKCPEVYEWCGRGRSHLLRASYWEVPQAIEAFQSAIALDPCHASAHAGLALAYCAQAELRAAPPADAFAKARAAALRALGLDDHSTDAQVALGSVLFLGEWDWAGAEKSLQRALELNHNHTEAYLLYGRLLEARGRLEDGLAMKLRALERDPFSPLVHLQISLAYWNQRRYDDAIDWANKTLEIDPRHPHAREHLAGAYLKKGDFDRYMEENLQHARVHGAPPEALVPLQEAYAAGGRAGVVRLVLQRAAQAPQAFLPLQLALFCGEAGDLDAAFAHLERSIEGHDPALVHLAVAPQWDCLRSDRRFEECVARMGLGSLKNS